MVLQSVGDNGRYQRLFYWLFLVPINVMIPWIALVPLFQASVPDHWCHVPGRPHNVSLHEWKQLVVPREDPDDKYNKCYQYAPINHTSSLVVVPQSQPNNSRPVIECQSGWDYNTTWYDQTLSMQLDWVCQRGSFSARWLSAAVAGNMFGTLLFNSLSDHWGRKRTVILTSLVFAIFGTVRLFMTSLWGHLVMMFLSSMPFPAIIQIAYIWVLEQVSRDLRAQITSVACVMWTVGMCSVPLLAWLTRDWILLGLITSLPFGLVLFVHWMFPESPSWLVSRGRLVEANQGFETIARVNLRKCPVDIQLTLSRIVETHGLKDKKASSFVNVIDLFRLPVLRWRSFLLITTYTCNYMMYYLLIYTSVQLSGNEFLNFFLLAVTELPANVAGWVGAQGIGRRWTGVLFFVLATATAFAAIFVVSSDASPALIALVVTSKAFCTVSFFVVYIQVAELYPTTHRGTGIGVASIVSLLLGISAPYIAYTGSQWPSLPYLILTLFGLVGTWAALYIPETKGARLPQTLQDAEGLLADHTFWSYLGWTPGKRLKDPPKDANEDAKSS